MDNKKGSGLRGKYTKEEIARRYLKKLKWIMKQEGFYDH